MNLNRLRVISLAAVLGTTAAFAQDVAVPPSHGKMMPGKMAGMSDQSAKMTAMHQQMMANMDNMCKEMMNHMAHPDMPMMGMGVGKAPAGSPK